MRYHSCLCFVYYMPCQCYECWKANRSELRVAYLESSERVQRRRQHRDPIPRLCFERSMRVSLAPAIILGHLSGECGPCIGPSGLKPNSSRNALFAKLKNSQGHCGCCEGYVTLDISPGIFSECRSFHRAADGSSSYSKREV